MNKERKLMIAGNWKMNKTVAEALRFGARPETRTGRGQGGGHRRLPAVHRAGRCVQGRHGFQPAAGRAEHERAQFRRLHRRNRRRHAQGILRPLCHPRPLRAAPALQGNHRVGRAKNARRARRLAQADCLRGRNLAGTRGRPDRAGARRAGARQPGRVDGGADGGHDHRLRTRSGPSAPARTPPPPRPRKPTLLSAVSWLPCSMTRSPGARASNTAAVSSPPTPAS